MQYLHTANADVMEETVQECALEYGAVSEIML